MRTSICVAAVAGLVAGVGSAASAGVSNIVDWDSGWALSDLDGTYQNGAFNNSATFGGIDVDVTFQLMGTATGEHNFLPDSPGTSTSFNGDQSSTDSALVIGDSRSQNGNSFDNFVVLTVNFSQAVDITSLAIGDTDISGGSSWQDAVYVRGTNGGAEADTSYSPGSNAFFETRTYSFADGSTSGMFAAGAVEFDAITGIANAGNDTADAQFDVSFSTMVDSIEIFYFNGPDTNNSNFRGIYIQSIGFVPTPGAMALLGLGGLAVVRRQR